MPDDPAPKRYWFPAKRYGWGWGFPLTWEGWMFFIGWVGTVMVVSPWLVVRSGWGFVAFLVVMVVVMFVVCFKTGEPPRWRWGGKD